MIGKTKVGKSFYGCIKYCINVTKKPEILKMEGLFGHTSSELNNQFNRIADLNKNVENKVWHTIISFASADKLTSDQMLTVSIEFLNRLKLMDHQYMVVRHHDANHEHLHIISNRVGFNGKALSDSNIKIKTVKIAKDLEKKYGLTIAKNQNNKLKAKVRETMLNGVKQKKSINQLMIDIESLGFKVLYNKTSSGNIRGISFIHKVNGTKFKLSEIDRKLSYHRLLRLYVSQGEEHEFIIDSRDKSRGIWR